ncbi:hypothetical protein DSO57_1027256 [Entomophthora muscae]|uniref:Uncharacterized protein n=1 Tax=Entomophthora muscae TaxID=34485 RepID=A0ACC2SED5_9FUNG|nr:hypothetical protein DSO57_1027256 [Entomophthora muscae]
MICILCLVFGICEAALLYGLRSFFVGIMLDGETYCGGALVQKEYVVTAAACLDKDISRYSVRLHRLGLEADFKADSFILHPGYYATYKPHSNIAIVKFHWPQSDSVKVDLDFVGISTFGYLNVSMVGWERMHGSANFNYSNLTLFDGSICSFYYPFVDLDSEFCAGSLGREMGSIDYGNPLIYSNEGIHVLVGIHSWSEPILSYNSTSMFTRVSRFSRWIESILDPLAYTSRIGFKRYTS